MKSIAAWLPLVLLVAACSSATSTPKAPPSVAAVSPTPTPGILMRINPNVIEETETYYIERLPKSEYVKVDDRHIQGLIVHVSVEFFKEDDNYYYISVPKMLPEEKLAFEQKKAQQDRPGDSVATQKTEPRVPITDLEDILPAVVESSFRLEKVADSSLPTAGMWRASFVIADVNGDGIPDVVSPAARIGDGRLKIWIGDGKGHFSEWPLSFTENGKALQSFSIDYGGVAVGDIDGDGHMDVVSASHGGGLVSLFGDGRGGFEVVRSGLPGRDFSSQAVILLDADGDGKLDIVASRDVADLDHQPDLTEVRLYLFEGREKGWKLSKEGISGAPFSNSLALWHPDGQGRPGFLTGSHWIGPTRLLWKSEGDGTFTNVPIPDVEVYSYHFATVPGTFGKRRAAAFADSFVIQGGPPENARAAGISLYSAEDGQWTRHRIWRKRDPKSTVYGLAFGDLDGDGLDDVVFLDNDVHRIRILLQQANGSFGEVPEKEEPILDSFGQCVRLVDLDRDGRLDFVVSKTVTSANPEEKGGWDVYRNTAK